MPQTAKNDDAKFAIPKGHDPSEFLRDEDLPEYYRRRAESAKTDEDRRHFRRLLNGARIAAAQTAAVIDALEDAEFDERGLPVGGTDE